MESIFRQSEESSTTIYGPQGEKPSLWRGQSLDWVHQPYSGGSHHQTGLGPGAAGGLQAKGIMYKPNSLWTWLFVIVTCVQAAIVLGFESYVVLEPGSRAILES